MKLLIAALIATASLSSFARTYSCTRTSQQGVTAKVKLTNFSEDFSVVEIKTEGRVVFSGMFHAPNLDPRMFFLDGKIQVEGDEKSQEARLTGSLDQGNGDSHLALYVQDRRIELGFGFHMVCK